MPQSQDHPVHLARAWHFLTQNLAQGQLSGWSDTWFAGWPSGEDYPPGADYVVALVHLASFGLLGWEASYALAFTGVFALSAIAIYVFGKTYLNELAGFLAAIFYLFDRGFFREGGWSYTVHWGVWPQILSTAFLLFAFAALDSVVTRGRRRDFVWCGLATGFSILSHPMAILSFAVGVPLYVLLRWRKHRDQPFQPMLGRMFAPLFLGALLSAYWWLPFADKGAWMANYGEEWKSLGEMAIGLLRGSLFHFMAPPILWLASAGGALAFWRKSFGASFTFAFGLAILLLSSSSLHDLLLHLSSALERVQFQRFLILGKVLVFLLAGFALSELWQWLGRSRLQRVTRPLFVLAVLALLLVPLFGGDKEYGGRFGRPKTSRDIDWWGDYQAFLAWSKALPKDPFFRIAYLGSYHDHSLSAAPVWNHLPALKIGFTPATNFIVKPDRPDAELYRLLSVKYLLSRKPLYEPGLTLEKQFGSLRVYRNQSYRPDRVTVIGPGQAKVLEFSPERVRVRMHGAAPTTRLVLHRANYPNWKATHDGKPIPIETRALGEHDGFIGVHAPDGTYEFNYGWTRSNVVGTVLSILALVGFALFAVSRLAPLGSFALRHGLVLSVIGTGALLLVLLVARGGRTTETSLLSRADTSHSIQSYVAFHRCLRPPIRFPNITLGKTLRGHHGFDDPGFKNTTASGQVVLHITWNGQPLGEVARPTRPGWAAFELDTTAHDAETGELAFTMTSTTALANSYCFDASLLR
jgi:hypothetical protein